MANTDGIARRARRPAHGPHSMFAASALLAFLILAISGRPLPDGALPMAVMLLFGLAAVASVFAWKSRQRRAGTQLTYWDVAGALVLIGVGLSVLIEPEQLAGVIESQSRRP
jgi:hypothetical protein